MWKPQLADDTSRPLYRTIVQAISEDIAQGRLGIGARLPPHRELADELKIARGTVARAYREAEKLGLVRSDVGRGTYVLAPDIGARSYSSLLEPPVIGSDLSTNLPLTGIDPDPGGVLRRLAQRPDLKSLLRYHSPFGMGRHRLAGVRWLERMSVEATVDDVLLCAGAQHALFITLSHLKARARAIYVEELTYPGVHGVAEMLGLPMIAIAMDGEGMSAEGLERACRRHGPGVVYLMPTIHNPTGIVMSDARRSAIARLANAKGLFIIEDAANRMLATRPPPPVAHYAPERTFLIASVSKVLLPGLRVAFLVAPPSERAALARQVWATQWMVNPIGAEIVAMWVEDGTLARTVKRKRREAVRRQALARRVFADHSLQSHPESLHVWLWLPDHWRAERLLVESARQNIVVTPSSAFWTRRSAPPRAIRIALGGVDEIAELARGLATVAQIVAA